jgi:hypothetical protein
MLEPGVYDMPDYWRCTMNTHQSFPRRRLSNRSIESSGTHAEALGYRNRSVITEQARHVPFYISSLSTSTPLPTVNTNPSPSLTPAFHASNLPLCTTSHLCCLSFSASSTLIAGANFNTSTLLTASRVTNILCGQEVGIAGRKADAEVDVEDRMVAQESSVANRWTDAVSNVDAVASGLVLVELVELRIAQLKASMSLRITEWTRRCKLLCRDASNK